MRSVTLLAALLAILPLGASVGGEGPVLPRGTDEDRRPARTHRIDIRQMRFQPARLVVAPGDTVLWVNQDFLPHSATATDDGWDSGRLEQGDRWSHVVEAGGSVDFTCRFHPNMSGRLVQDGRTPTNGDDQ